jgi:protein-arginine deiminase
MAFVLVACGGGGSSGGGSAGGGTPLPGGGTPPAPDFMATPTSGTTATAIQFSDLSAGGPTVWAWDFDGDSITDSTAQNPSFTYPQPGTYSVSLTVSNANGANSFTRTAYITITGGGTTAGVADIDADTNRDGTITAADDTNEHVWNATQGAIYYFNIDDDNNNNVADHADGTRAATDPQDWSRIIVRQFNNPPAGGSAVVNVSTAAQSRIRIFRNTGASWTTVYSTGASFTLPIADVGAGDIELAIEGRERLSPSWDGRVTLTLQIRNSSGTVVDSDAVILRMAPPVFATNLWEVSEFHVVNMTGSSWPNAALRTAMQSICTQGGITYREVPGASYSYDRWLQDSSEPAVVLLPSASGPRRVVDHVFQCARWRQVDQWCRNTLWGPDFDFFERFSGNDNSHNYGGNLEVVPPYTGRPWGKIAFGGGTGVLVGTSTQVTSRMTQVYRDFFNAAEVQGPFLEYTSEWLAVGHIDEFTMFVPAPNTTRGWVCLIASPVLAFDILDQAASNATVFAGRGSHQTTAGALRTDMSLRNLNTEVQARIDQARAQIKAGTNLTDADFIEFPTIFENVASNYLAALNPGSVNLICLPSGNNTTYFAIPDPEGPNNASGQDMWQLDMTTKLNALATGARPFSITYVDVFYSYHTSLGEAHCGSNTVRIPPDMDWWNQ